MKKTIAIILSVLLVLSFAACGAPAQGEPVTPPVDVAPTPEAPSGNEETPADIASVAEEIVTLMTQQDFEGVMNYASDLLKSMADANYIASLWASVAGALGEFEKVDTNMTVRGNYMTYESATVFCEFSAGGLGVILLFDPSGMLDSIAMNYYTPMDLYAFSGNGEYTPLFWEVTSPDGAKMYMFGSYHLAAADFYPLPDVIMNAYAESDAIAVEYDTFAATFDFASLVEMSSAMAYADGSTGSSHLKPDTYQLAVDFMNEKGVYNAALETYHLAQWSSYLMQAACAELGFTSVYGVDSVLLNMAHQEGKKVLEVESQGEQLALLTSTSDLYNDASIRSAVEEFDEGKEYISDLFAAYSVGDEARLSELLLDDDFEEDDLAAYTAEEREAIIAEAEEYDKRMMSDRNYGMAEKAEEYLASGETVFFVVGLAHMLGDDGLVQLLTNEGYTVERVEY